MADPVALTYVGECSRGWYWEVVRYGELGYGYCLTRRRALARARRWSRRGR